MSELKLSRCHQDKGRGHAKTEATARGLQPQELKGMEIESASASLKEVVPKMPPSLRARTSKTTESSF